MTHDGQANENFRIALSYNTVFNNICYGMALQKIMFTILRKKWNDAQNKKI